jgi:hypothetical protein
LQTSGGVILRPAVEPRRLRLFRELRVRDPAFIMGCNRVPHIEEALLSPTVAKVGLASLSLFEHSAEFLVLGRRCPVVLHDRAGDPPYTRGQIQTDADRRNPIVRPRRSAKRVDRGRFTNCAGLNRFPEVTTTRMRPKMAREEDRSGLRAGIGLPSPPRHLVDLPRVQDGVPHECDTK